MNYTLAKKLKDADFPQSFPHDDRVEMHDALKIQKIKNKYINKNDPYYPTLEELINACGLCFKSLDQGYTDIENWWNAYGSNGGASYCCDGDTPTEAIAMLWLKLNNQI